MRITLWIVSQQSIPFFTTYKMIRLFSLFPFVTSRWWSAPVKFVRKSFITLRNLDGALYRSIAKLSFPSEAIIIDIDEKIFTSFHVFIYLSASSRSIQPRHINIISTSFYFIFPTIHRALFPTPSSIIFIKLSQVQTHYITRRFFISYSSFHSIFFLNFITQSGSHFFIHNNIISITFLYISSSFFTIYSINPYSFEPIQKLMFI